MSNTTAIARTAAELLQLTHEQIAQNGYVTPFDAQLLIEASALLVENDDCTYWEA